MKTGIFSKYATLAALSASVIALNNCGHRTDSESSYTAKDNGNASDLAIRSIPPAGYPVAGGIYAPLVSIETNCNDGVDNNGNGLVDCMDPACQAANAECSEWGPPVDDIINGNSTTIYPNGILVPETVAFLKARGVRGDDAHHWQRTEFFPSYAKDCWVSPLVQDPYYNVSLGSTLLAGPSGAIGPAVFRALHAIGPRAGLINECEPGTDLFEYFMDNDDGPGDGANGDHDDEEGGNNQNNQDD